MAAMRQELKAIKTQAGPRSPPVAPAPSHHETPAMEPAPQPQPQPQPHESAPFAPVHSNKENSRPSPTAESVELDHLRRQLELANSTIGVLRETRDQAMLSPPAVREAQLQPDAAVGAQRVGAQRLPSAKLFGGEHASRDARGCHAAHVGPAAHGAAGVHGGVRFDPVSGGGPRLNARTFTRT